MSAERKAGKGKASAAISAFSATHVSESLEHLGLAVSPAQARGIADYLSLLLRWNQRVSLTSITDPEEILARHLAESLIGARIAGIVSGKLLDIGSGAGFPALPIAFFFPEIQEVLLEPNVKKAAFLAEACRVLEIFSRVKIRRERLETFDPADVWLDFITSRAVRLTPDFLERCRRLLHSGGKLVLWLGEADANSARDARGWTWSKPSKIPGSERRVILCGTPAADGSDVSRETPDSPRFT